MASRLPMWYTSCTATLGILQTLPTVTAASHAWRIGI
jgi:hypothetical protein